MLRAMKHTSATMFVDDFVIGRVPDVCAVTGAPTKDRLVTSTEIDGPSPGWLFLLLFSLLGWLILALVLAFSRRTHLQGELPLSESAYTARRRQRRWWYLGLATGMALVVASVFFLRNLAQLGGVGVLVGLAVVLVAGVGLISAFTGMPRITLDGSRRWVTIHRVHPDFAAAVSAQEERRRLAV